MLSLVHLSVLKYIAHAEYPVVDNISLPIVPVSDTLRATAETSIAMLHTTQSCGGPTHGIMAMTSPTTLAYPLTHSTHSSVTNTTIPSTTSYPYALTMVVRTCVPMCPSVCSYVYPLWVSVLLCLLVLQVVADYSTSYYCIPSRRSTTHPFVCCGYYCIACQAVYMIPRTLSTYGTSICRYPSVSWSVSSCEIHYNITVYRHT